MLVVYRCLVLYCRDCSQAACEMCFIQLHNGHRYANIDDVVDQLRTQLDSLLDTVQSRTSAVTDQLNTLEQYRAELKANVNVRLVVIGSVVSWLERCTCDSVVSLTPGRRY